MLQLRYVIIGTGAIGGYYGARLQQSGCEVHFLCRSNYDEVKQQGLKVASINGDFELPVVQAYRQAAHIPPVDVAIIALKTTQNHLVHELLPPLNAGGVILCLQNGYGVEGAIAEQLEAKGAAVPAVVGGLCFIGAFKAGHRNIQHTDYGHVVLGAHQADGKKCVPTPVMTQIAADFRAAAVQIDLTDDLPMARWRKLVWNVPYNGLSVVLDATTEEMMEDAGVRSLITTLMEEVVTVANAWGEKTSPGTNRHLPPGIVSQMLTQTKKMAPYCTSMKRDYDARRPLELEAIFTRAIHTANVLNVPMPATTTLYQQLAFLNKQN